MRPATRTPAALVLLLPLLLGLPAVRGDCGLPPVVPNALPDLQGMSSFPDGTYLAYSCVPGTVKMPGYPDAVYCDKGQWTKLAEFCNRSCDVPTRLLFASLQKQYITLSYFPVGSSVMYKCRAGFQRVKSLSRKVTCLPNLMWSKAAEFCKKKSCPHPGEIQNGHVTITTDILYGASITFSCNAGYELVGADSSYCYLKGYTVGWTDPLPECKALKPTAATTTPASRSPVSKSTTANATPASRPPASKPTTTPAPVSQDPGSKPATTPPTPATPASISPVPKSTTANATPASSPPVSKPTTTPALVSQDPGSKPTTIPPTPATPASRSPVPNSTTAIATPAPRTPDPKAITTPPMPATRASRSPGFRPAVSTLTTPSKDTGDARPCDIPCESYQYLDAGIVVAILLSTVFLLIPTGFCVWNYLEKRKARGIYY